MKRNVIVLAMMVAGLSLMVWAGIENYRANQQEQARVRALQSALNAAEAQANGSSQDGGNSGMPDQQPLLGQQAPNFTLVNLQGKRVSLADYRGKAVVVDFWATWCGPCRMEIPWLVQLNKKYASQGLTVLGVATDTIDSDTGEKDPHSAIAKFAQQHNMDYPILLADMKVANQYGGIDSIPTTFFINRSGKVVASTVGLAPRSDIEADIEKALSTGGTA
ncbi:MAG: TlpA family protein disulfide reductase [Acidobacteriaceae bacterium]